MIGTLQHLRSAAAFEVAAQIDQCRCSRSARAAARILALMQAIGTTDPACYDGLIGHLVNASKEGGLSEQKFMLSVVKGIQLGNARRSNGGRPHGLDDVRPLRCAAQRRADRPIVLA
jgi:hypothetical protein